MNGTPPPCARTAFLSCLALAALAMTGCVAPVVKVNPNTNLDQYHKVYLAHIKNDTRKLHPRVAERLKTAGFDVVQISPDGPAVDSQGTGFLVTPDGHVVTCAHVLTGHTNATVWINGTRHVGRILSMDTNSDVAVIHLLAAPAGAKPLPFAANHTYRMGQDTYTIGFPLVEMLGSAPRLNKGLISSTVGMEDDTNQLQISVAVQPGNSGGPLLNERGEVIGIVTGTLNPMNVLSRTGGALPQNVNFALKAEPAREFLKKASVTLPAATEAPAGGFDEAKDSIAIVRGGIVTDDDVKRPALFCRYDYFAIWDMYYRLRVFHIEFYDTRKGEWVMKAGRYRDDLSSEDAVLDMVFAEIYSYFHPAQPNPFRNRKKEKPAPQPKET